MLLGKHDLKYAQSFEFRICPNNWWGSLAQVIDCTWWKYSYFFIVSFEFLFRCLEMIGSSRIFDVVIFVVLIHKYIDFLEGKMLLAWKPYLWGENDVGLEALSFLNKEYYDSHFYALFHAGATQILEPVRQAGLNFVNKNASVVGCINVFSVDLYTCILVIYTVTKSPFNATREIFSEFFNFLFVVWYTYLLFNNVTAIPVNHDFLRLEALFLSTNYQ